MKLSELTKSATFTLKIDFNMTGFLLSANPDEAFKAHHMGAETFERTNTTSNIKLKDNIELKEDDVCRLIEAGRTVFIFYEVGHKLDCYNVPETDVLGAVMAY